MHYRNVLVLVLDILLAIFARLQSAKAKRIGLETPQSLSRSPILEYNIGFIRIHISQYIEKINRKYIYRLQITFSVSMMALASGRSICNMIFRKWTLLKRYEDGGRCWPLSVGRPGWGLGLGLNHFHQWGFLSHFWPLDPSKIFKKSHFLELTNQLWTRNISFWLRQFSNIFLSSRPMWLAKRRIRTVYFV